MKSVKRNRLVLAVVFGGLCVGMAASQPGRFGVEEPKIVKQTKFKFEKSDASWSEVIDWLGAKAGLEVTYKLEPPVGNVKYTGGADHLFTADELISALNVELKKQKAMLLRRDTTLTLMSVDEKLLEFQMDAVPWSKVFTWLVDHTKVEFVGEINKVSGSLTFVGPKGKLYTTDEIVDIINTGLQAKKFILLRRDAGYTVIPADTELDGVPMVSLADLYKRGKTEVVRVIVQLRHINSDEFAPEVKKMLGPSATVIPVNVGNQLILQDLTQNLRLVLNVIRDLENIEEKGLAQSFNYVCQYIPAERAAKTLKEFLGEGVDRVMEMKGPGPGGPGRGPLAPTPGEEGKTEEGKGGGKGNRPTVKVKYHFVTFDELSNSVHVNAPANHIAKAKNLLTSIDKEPYKDAPKYKSSPPILKQYTVQNADQTIKMLQAFHKDMTAQLFPIGQTSLMVYGRLDEHVKIATTLDGQKEPTMFEQIALSVTDATHVATLLKNVSPDPKVGGPTIDFDSARNVLYVKGTANQLKDIKEYIKVIDGSASLRPGSMAVLTLDKGGSASILADALMEVLQKRGARVEVLKPAELLERPDRKEPPQVPKENKGKVSGGDGGGGQPAEPKIEQKADANAPKNDNKSEPEIPKVKKDGPVIRITAFGNKLIVNCDDPETLKLVQEVVRLFQTAPGDEFTVINLKYANAVDAARILDEFFNGPKQQGGGGGPRGPGGGGPRGPGGMDISAMIPGLSQITGAMNALGGAASGRVERIRVVADPNTNSLLVKANLLDMLTVKNMVNKFIDRADNDSEQIIKNQPILGPFTHILASDAYNVIREVFRESMNNNSRLAQFAPSGGTGFSFGGGGGSSSRGVQNIDANGNPRGVLLSMAVDEKTNSLFVACPDKLYTDIKKLVQMLEDKAKEPSPQVIEVVPVKGVDPNLLQHAIDAVQGRRSSSSSSSRFNSGSGPSFSSFEGSGFRFGPGGGSGFFGSGGGFQGGSMGGFNPGSMGGGTFRGGGGPGSTGGGFRPRNRMQSRGPDFFGPAVTDDQPLLFDPRTLVNTVVVDQGHGDPIEVAVPSNTEFFPVSFEDPQFVSEGPKEPKLPKFDPKAPKFDPKMGAKGLQVPRLPVTVEALPEIGAYIIRAYNQEDLKAAQALIDFIIKNAYVAEIKVESYQLRHNDATRVANYLAQLYSRVQVAPLNSTLTTGVTGVGGTAAAQQLPTAGPGQSPQATPGGQGQTGSQALARSSVVLIPLPATNTIIFATYGGRIDEVRKTIADLDKQSEGPLGVGEAKPFPLKRAIASRVATTLIQFYATRYPGDTNQVRITYDDVTNTVFVQASPYDMAQIESLIRYLDSARSGAENELRVVPLRFAQSDELATILANAILSGASVPTGALATTGTLAGQQQGAVPGLGIPGLGQQQGALGQGQVLTAGALQSAARGQGKASRVKFISGRPNGPTVEASPLDDVHIISDVRINALVIAATKETMELILALVRELDVGPNAKAEITIFTLKKADALNLANSLQVLFLGSSATGARPAGVPGPATPLGGLGATTGGPRLLPISLTTAPFQSMPLIDLRLTVDDRTNSLIAVGSRNDLDVIESIVAKLDDYPVIQRRSHAYRLINAQAADLANVLNDFFTKKITPYKDANQQTPYQALQREVIFVPDPISNTILIDATPQYFDEAMRHVANLDIMPPQVVIQVLLAEVDLASVDEFGVEIGLQTPVLFARSVINADATRTPGFLFNNVTIPIGNANNPPPQQGIVGFQNLTNLGVGRTSSNANFGGLVFSAASDTVNVLIRALRAQGRIDILSRPQVTALDGQLATMHVGQDFPYNAGSNATATGVISQAVARKTDLGVTLTVIPKINPDGRVVMRVTPVISSVDPAPVNLGNGQTGTAFNVQSFDSTVTVTDGETIVLGGLITNTENRIQNSIPILGDLPYIGAGFRYRTLTHTKKELLVVITPHIVRCREDIDRVSLDEARRIDWVEGRVQRIHGIPGLMMFPGVKPGYVPPPPPQGLLPELPPISTLPLTAPPSVLPPAEQAPPPKTITIPGTQSQRYAPPAGTGAGPLPVVPASPPPTATPTSISPAATVPVTAAPLMTAPGAIQQVVMQTPVVATPVISHAEAPLLAPASATFAPTGAAPAYYVPVSNQGVSSDPVVPMAPFPYQPALR
jgi:type II secretory pathway component GspD/PulD (secretin)